MPITDDLQYKWQLALSDLSRQMTQATFDAWLRGTRLVDIDAAADALVVVVPSEAARVWLENRLYGTVQRVVLAVFGYPWRIKFVAPHWGQDEADDDDPPSAPDQPPVVDGLEPEVVDLPDEATVAKLAGADYHKIYYAAGGLGYAMISHYAAYFWQPYLGQAFALWKRIDADERSSLKQVENRWSAPRRYRYRQLARALGKDHPRVIKGGPVECWYTKNGRINGRQVLGCCGNPEHQPSCAEMGADQLPRCLHWHRGLLQILADEGLAAVAATEAERWLNRLEVQVWRLFPVLTPWQVSRLNIQLQEEHERWLEGQGDRPKLGEALGVTLREWEQIEARTLVPLMTGYADFRLLFDNYAPDAEFLAQAGFNNGGNFLWRAHHKIEDDLEEMGNLVARTPQGVDIMA